MSDDVFDKLASGKSPRKRVQTTIKDLDSIDPARWASFINALEAGASWNAAAGILRVSPATVQAWMDRGKGARSGPYARFYKEVIQALQMATAVAEAKVKERSPEQWLRNGPGRHVSPEWRDDGKTEDVNINLQGQVQTSGMLQIAPTDITAALLELQNAGVNLEHLTRPQAALTGSVLKSEELNEDGSPIDDDDEDAAETVGTNYKEGGRWESNNPQLPPLLAEPLSRAGITPQPKPAPKLDLRKLSLSERLARLSLSSPKKTS